MKIKKNKIIYVKYVYKNMILIKIYQEFYLNVDIIFVLSVFLKCFRNKN